MEVYCVKERRFTPNVSGSEKTVTTKNARKMLKVKCASCGITKTKFLKNNVGSGIFDTVADTGMEMFIQHGIPWLGKKAVEQGRYFASEMLRTPSTQKRLTKKAKKLGRAGLDYAIENLSKDLFDKASDKLRPSNMRKGGLSGRGNYSDWYPMHTYTDTTDPTNPLYERGE